MVLILNIMKYSELCRVYGALEATSKGLEKTKILADFLEKIRKRPEVIYLLQGKVFADYDKNELGISGQLGVRAIARAYGLKDGDVVKKFKDLGDLGNTLELIHIAQGSFRL